MKPTDIDILQLVREYVAQEILTESTRQGSPLTVRVLGEVLANKPGFSEAVHALAVDVARELATPRPKPTHLAPAGAALIERLEWADNTAAPLALTLAEVRRLLKAIKILDNVWRGLPCNTSEYGTMRDVLRDLMQRGK